MATGATGIDLTASTGATITFTGVGVADETVKIGNDTYVYKAAPSAAYEVDIKTDATTQAAALVSAINLDGTAGAYGALHVTQSPYVSATSAAGVITLTSRIAGTIGGGIAIQMTATNGTNIAAGATLAGTTGGAVGSGALPDAIAAAKTGMLDPKSKTLNFLNEII